jgi:multidrug efflux pump subunit AcrA (membrane-fusion protein)
VSSAEAQLALTAATYKDAQYAISLSLANLDSAKLALSEATLKSPMAGTVASISGIVGQSTGGTQQTTSSLIVISKLDNLAIISNLDEEDISKIKVGQKIEAEFPSLGKTVTGSVTYVSQVAKTDSNGSVTYEVRMDFVDKDMSIIDGMNASIKFITKSVEGVVRVPNKAVKMVSGKSTVSYYDAAKNILTKEVTTGFTDGLNVEIVTGLLAGDKYVIVEIK